MIPDHVGSLFGDAQSSIGQYVDILTDRGIGWGLLGPREADRLWDRHILNSVALSDLLPHGAAVADVGSGAGLPGLPLAILRPDLDVTLIEPLLRRFSFLQQSVEDLGLGERVSVIRSRADEVDQTFDVVTARALAPLPRLLEWCAPLRRSDGAILALKGRSAPAEVEQAAPQLERFKLVAEVCTVRALPDSEPTSVVRVASR